MARRKVVFAGPADFMDRDGVILEMGMRVSIMDGEDVVGYGDVCGFDEDSSAPIGVAPSIDPYPSEDDIRWLACEDILAF